MTKRAAIIALCALAATASRGEKGEDIAFNASVSAEIASGYLASSGAIYDTMPVSAQEFYWFLDLGDYGYFDGYAWTISALHNRQNDIHRPLFNEFEGAVRYGMDFSPMKDLKIRTKAGPLWNPPIGYHGSHQNVWGPYINQSFETPFATPYWAGLWLMAPHMRGRIVMGLRRSFAATETISITPFIETVWMDRRRFNSRYGGDPEIDHFFGGTFATISTGVRFSWHFAPNWSLYASILQFDVVNSQARRALRKSRAYYAKCDWPIAKVGVSHDF